MKPGTLIALVMPESNEAFLGTTVQPIRVDDERRWSIEWRDGMQDEPDTTWPERWLRVVRPQHV